MSRPWPRTLISVSLVVVLLAAPVAAQLCPPTAPPPVDNRDGYMVQFEEIPANPMTLSSNGNELWVVNIPDARVSVFDATNPTAAGGPTLLAEIAVGLDPVTIRRRPSTPLSPPEIWVVCSSSNSVFVIDEASRTVTATIRVEHEPTDLVFDTTGTTAYVTTEATNRIGVVNANTRQRTNWIEFESTLPTVGGAPIHGEEPFSVMLEGNNLYAVSHMSGNGTTFNPNCGTPMAPVPCFPFVIDPGIANLWTLFNQNPLLPEPPDRDIFRFDVTNPGVPGTVVGWRFGTKNFDLAREPNGPNLVVSNVDLKNDQFVFEPLVALSRMSEHRISMGPDAPAAISNTAVTHFDLNDAANVNTALTTLGYTCSFPNEMAWNNAGDRLYVACYGTNNVAVLDYPPTQVLAELRSNALPLNLTGFGTHGLLLDENRGVVYTFEQGDSSLQVYSANPATGTVNSPVRTVPIGYDITPANIESGRFHFSNAKNSTFGTDSCATCHYQGHTDGLAWNLGDLSGDLPTQPGQPPVINRLIFRDNKLLKVTMSLRNIEETPPFHWRGDRDDLQAFGGAQMGLLGGNLLSQQELEDIDDFIFSLSYRPNPAQAFNRAYSAQAIDGFSCFTNRTPLTFGADTNGATITVSCEQCHAVGPEPNGTNNQVNNDCGANPCPEDATHMRGTFDKGSDQVVYVPGGGANFTIPATGWGFSNSGAVDTLDAFVQGAGGGLPVGERNAISAFFREFDNGIAHTSAFAWTMDQVSVANPLPQGFIDTVAGADNGDNELIARGHLLLGGAPVPIGMLYLPNPGVPFGGSWLTDSAAFGVLSGATVIQAAQLGLAVWHFIGTPVGMGWRLGVDREMDFALDGNEQATCPAPPAVCSSSRTADTDGDFYPDGYETRLNTNPNDATSFPTSDTVAPAISNAALRWDSGSVAKVSWSTNEESKSRVEVRDSANAVVYAKEESQFKLQHSMIVRNLDPAASYTITVESEDPANANIPFLNGNRAQQPVPLTTQPRLFVNTMHVETTTLTVQGTNPNNTVQLLATFTLHDGATSTPLANAPVTLNFNFFEWVPGAVGAIPPAPMVIAGNTDAQGRVSMSFPTVGVLAGQSGVAEVISTSVVDPVGFRMLFQVESGLEGFGTKINLP